MSVAEHFAAIEAEEKRGRLAVRNFVDAARRADLDGMAACFRDLEGYGYIKGAGWDSAMRELAKIEKLPALTQEYFAEVWNRKGDHIRGECHKHEALIIGLRRLLPAYQGKGGIQLYRGETAWNRRSRAYGISWTSDWMIAQSFAEFKGTSHGGGVLLGVIASKEAIIAKMRVASREREYLVDRRFLRDVFVIKRFPRPKQAIASN